jgi:ribonuclease BN (tRNA processing enzyme)
VPLVHAHEVQTGGVLMQDENVKVTAALVHHPPVSPAFGYRFDTAHRSIVISGDTTPTKSLIELARGADVLVHDALFEPALDRLGCRAPQFPW